MKITYNKLKITSAILGPIGLMWFVSLAISYNTLTVHEALFRIGVGLCFIALALEPGILFQTIPGSIKEAGKRPMPFSPLVLAISKFSQLFLILAGIAWLIA